MYKCLDCHAEFDKPEMFLAYHSEVDTRKFEGMCCCPQCGSTDIEGLHLCDACKEVWSTDDVCKDCTEAIYKALNQAIEQLKYDLGCEAKPMLEVIDKWVESLS